MSIFSLSKFSWNFKVEVGGRLLGTSSTGFKVLFVLNAEEKVASAPIDVFPEMHELARVVSTSNLCEGV
jgi:hypothetical protein